jgi:hypothetical protein
MTAALELSRLQVPIRIIGKMPEPAMTSRAVGDQARTLVDGDLPTTDFHIFSSQFGFMGLFPMGDRRFRLIAINPLDSGITLHWVAELVVFSNGSASHLPVWEAVSCFLSKERARSLREVPVRESAGDLFLQTILLGSNAI